MPLSLHMLYMLYQSINRTTEGCERKSCELEVLECEGDTDDGNAEERTEDGVKNALEKTEENEPHHVEDGVSLDAAIHSLAEGRDSELSALEELQTKGDADDRNAAERAEQAVHDRVDETAANEPDKVAKEFHWINPPLKMLFRDASG